MNLGLGNLTELKAQLLAKSLRAGTDNDTVIQSIGSGVASRFQKFCNRNFHRVESATYMCRADRDHVYLDRYPVEEIGIVELKSSDADGWITQPDFVVNSNFETGLVYWGAEASQNYAQLRFTFTGGFWFDTSEDASGEIPVGATSLPDDLKLAWFLQCRAVWQSIDKVGTKIVDVGSGSQSVIGTISSLELLPDVKETLMTYRRLQLT